MILFWLAFDIWGAAKGGGGVAYFAHLGGFFGGVGLALLMLKLKWVEMNPRYERSLVDIFTGRHKPAVVEPVDWKLGWITRDVESASTLEPASAPAPVKAPPTTIPFPDDDATERRTQTRPVAQKPAAQPAPNAEPMIRFMCRCGKRIKVPAKYAGKVGKCPLCKNPVKIPTQ
jgi:hypothetical protein